MGKMPENKDYWEESDLYKDQERKRQQKVYRIWRETTLSISKRIAEGDPKMLEVYPHLDHQGMNGETLEYTIHLFRDGKTEEEAGLALDEFMKKNSPRYQEEIDRNLNESIDEDIANGMPHLRKMWKGLEDHDAQHEHDN